MLSQMGHSCTSSGTTPLRSHALPPARRTDAAFLQSARTCAPVLRRANIVRAAASPELSTVRIITQGRHVEVTPALQQYVVRYLYSKSSSSFFSISFVSYVRPCGTIASPWGTRGVDCSVSSSSHSLPLRSSDVLISGITSLLGCFCGRRICAFGLLSVVEESVLSDHRD